jgi:hypothetical protein
MNHLEAVEDGRWRLSKHAHVVVHETDDGNDDDNVKLAPRRNRRRRS